MWAMNVITTISEITQRWHSQWRRESTLDCLLIENRGIYILNDIKKTFWPHWYGRKVNVGMRTLTGACMERLYIAWKESQTNTSQFKKPLSFKVKNIVVWKIGKMSKYHNDYSMMSIIEYILQNNCIKPKFTLFGSAIKTWTFFV